MLIANRDLRQLFLGLPAVVLVGLAAGAVAHPTLNLGEIGGPQLQAGTSGVRSPPAAGIVSWAAYGPDVPEYVTGTDWTRPPADDDALDARIEAIDDAPVMAWAADDHAADAYEPAAAPETALQPVSYPSTDGGAVYEQDLPPPPEPPMDEVPAAG